MAGEGVAEHGLAEFRDGRAAEAPLGRSEPRLSLRAAGAVRDVIGRERVEERVNLRERDQRIEARAHERQRTVRGLLQRGAQKIFKVGSGLDLAILRDSFESTGMGEAAGRKGRIRELPNQPRRCIQVWRIQDGSDSVGAHGSEQEVALGEREDGGRFAPQKFAVGDDLIRLGIDGDFGERVVPFHIALGKLAAAPDWLNSFGQAVFRGHPIVMASAAHERDRDRPGRSRTRQTSGACKRVAAWG